MLDSTRYIWISKKILKNLKKDPLEELYRKPDPTLADGQNYNVNKFPKELLGCQIEDIDYYYRNKKVTYLRDRTELIYETIIDYGS